MVETKTPVKRHFLTVDRCNSGRRGIFCSNSGSSFSQDHPFTEDEAWEVLGPFDLVLSPESIELTEEELKAYNKWCPLAEYSNRFGVATKGAC